MSQSAVREREPRDEEFERGRKKARQGQGQARETEDSIAASTTYFQPDVNVAL